MELEVKLEKFEGPLDLLLHLIEKNKVDIYDIPIAEITDQYLEYVRQMDHEDMNIASEFMVMAATLIDIKCKMLLPKDAKETDEEGDPREELVRQLLEYKQYKYMAEQLKDCMDEAGELCTRPQDLPGEVLKYRPPVDAEKLLDGMTLDKLSEIFRFVLKRQEEKVDPVRSRFGSIEIEDITLPEQLDFVEKYARKNRHFSFRKLLVSQHTKMRTIVTFLAVLELIKAGRIHISQKKMFGDIEIDSLEELDGKAG